MEALDRVKLTMAGYLDRCLLLAYSVPQEQLSGINLPPGFRLQTHGGRAFWNVVVCHIDKMRPAGMPRAVGISYSHVAYRLYVEVNKQNGETLQGLYFTHSQADDRLICAAGNLMSDFRFSHAEVSWRTDGDVFTISGKSYAGHADAFRLKGECLLAAPKPLTDTFESAEQALQVLKYRPLGLALRRDTIKIAEVVRNEADWREYQFAVEDMNCDYLQRMEQEGARLELATWVDPIDYRWKLGETTPITPRT